MYRFVMSNKDLSLSSMILRGWRPYLGDLVSETPVYVLAFLVFFVFLIGVRGAEAKGAQFERTDREETKVALGPGDLLVFKISVLYRCPKV